MPDSAPCSLARFQNRPKSIGPKKMVSMPPTAKLMSICRNAGGLMENRKIANSTRVVIICVIFFI